MKSRISANRTETKGNCLRMLPKTILFITMLVIGSGSALDAASAKTVIRSSDANKQIKSGGQPKTASPADKNYEEGLTALKARDFKKAERCFQTGLKLDPNSVKCNLGMAKTEQQWRSDHDIAIWYLDKALAQEPKLVEAIKLRGLAYGAKQNYRRSDRRVQHLDRNRAKGGRIPVPSRGSVLRRRAN